MAGGKASVLLIRIAGDSTGATKALNQVATATAAASVVVEGSSDKMVDATEKHIAALKLEHEAEMDALKMSKIRAEQAEKASRDQLEASRQSLKVQQVELRAAQLSEEVDEKAIRTKRESIIATQRQIIAQAQHTTALARNTKAAATNIAALERLQRQEIEQATVAKKTADMNVAAGKKSSMKYLGIAGAVAAGVAVVTKNAMMLESATSAVNAIWGESADEMLAWAEGLSDIGLSTAQAAQASAILGSQLMNLGVPMDQAMVATQTLITLSTDMASAFGTTVPQALTALSAAFRNEYDSLEKYGISLSATTVAAQMEAEAAAGMTFATANAARAHATYTLILEQTKEIQGLTTDTTVTLQEATNNLRGSFQNVTAEIGGHLLPILTPLIDGLATTLGVTGELIDENGLLASVSEYLTGVFENMWTIIEPILIPALEALDAIFQTLADFMNTYVIPILDKVTAAFDRIAGAITNVVEGIQDLITWIDNLWTHGAENDAAAAAAAYAVQAATRRYNLSTYGLTAAGRALPSAPQGITINIQSGIGDPHAIAREIRKVLRRDEQRLGRVAAWL